MIAGSTFDPSLPPEGDFAFAGVKMRQHPSTVPAGYCSFARNTRFTRGVAEPRAGVYLLPWTNKVASPVIQPFTRIYGSGVFGDPNSLQWILQAADGDVYRLRESNGARVMTLPAGTTITSNVEFLQAMNVMLMFRGPSLAPLVMDNIDAGFHDVPSLDNDTANADQNPTDGTEQIPNASFGLFMQDRVFVPFDKDFIAASDFLNYTRYQPTLGAFKINVGDDQQITALHEFSETSMIVGKDRSVHLVTGVEGDLSNLARFTITDEYGIISNKAVVTVGKDVWFLATRRGICSVTQTETGKVQGVDIPVSDDIQPLIDRINWSTATNAVARKVGNFSYWAVPLDGSATNNAVLVYDHLNQAWAGYDDGTAIDVRDWLRATYIGTERLFMVTNTGYTALYEQGAHDQTTASTFVEISHTVRTRGYATRATLGRIRATVVHAQIRTWNPSYNVRLILDGVAELQTVATKTRDRTLYIAPWDAAPWTATNVNNDHATAFRQDYSAPIGTGSTRFYLGAGDGVDFGLHQETTETYHCPPGARGQYVQVEINGSQGRTELCGCALERLNVDPMEGVKA